MIFCVPKISEEFLSMSKSKHWKGYNIKHPEKVKIVEFQCISNKFSHTKKVRQRETKKKAAK